MEWFIGLYLGAVVFLGIYLIVASVLNSGRAIIGSGLLVFILYIGFGLIYEIPFNGKKMMRVVNGKVIESELNGRVAWQLYEYPSGIQTFEGSYLNKYRVRINYKIYWRVVGEDLNEAQRYYENVIFKKIETKELFEELQDLIQFTVLRDDDSLRHKIIQDYLKDFGIKVLAVE